MSTTVVRSYAIPHDLDDALRAEAERRRVPYTALVVDALRARLGVPAPSHHALAVRRPSLRAVRTPEIR